MLKKLMKYELKATSRLLIPLYCILFVMSLINRFVFKVNRYEGVLGIINQLLIAAYIMSIFAVLIATFIYMITRFYKNLLTDEGYLMFTLPAKAHQLITSKLLITLLWTILSVIAVGVSLLIALASPEHIATAISAIKEAIAAANREFGMSWILPFSEIIILILIGLVANILLVYVSIALGQLFSKHKIVGSFGAYMLIHIVLQFVMLIIAAVFGFFVPHSIEDAALVPRVIFPTIIVIASIGCACFYFITDYLFKKKLNLD